jgi:catechol 2,3-dioxygenase-like lactoylglutathione lyase family enzyme
MRLTHVRLLVDDFDACSRFYRDVLGFKPDVLTQPARYAEFEVGVTRLALYDRATMEHIVGAHPDTGNSRDHVLLGIEVANVDETYEALRAKGVEFAVGPTDRPDWYLRTAHFRDPEGNLIELYHGIHEH